MKLSRHLRVILSILLCVAVAGCSTMAKTSVESVQGRQVELLISRQSGPTVVFESGLDGTLQWWSKVWPEISAGSNALAYNRPGYGRSEGTSEPRDGAHIVAELRALLQAEQMPPPMFWSATPLAGSIRSSTPACIPRKSQRWCSWTPRTQNSCAAAGLRNTGRPG